MCVPVISVLRKNYPKLKITVLTTKFFSQLFNQVPDINFIFFEKKYKSLLGLWAFKNGLKKIKADYIIDLHNVLRTKILDIFINSTPMYSVPFLKLDKARKEKKKIIKGGQLKRLKTMHQRYADVFQKININLDLHKFSQYKKINISKKNYNFLNSKKLVGIAPFAKHSCKEYSLENIIKVIDLLRSKVSVILFGAAGKEQKRLKDIAKNRENTFSIAGELTLKEEMDVISNLDLMISMDSANGHIAALFGINVVSIWGATHPFLGYAPFGQPEKNSIVVDKKRYPKIPVSIYGSNCPKQYINAINSIKPEKILDKINEII